MQRVLETAGLALPGIPAEQEPDLREVDFGECEGLSFGEIQSRFPRIAQQWAEFHPELCFPGGESIRAYLERVQAAAHRVIADPRETLVVFSHGGMIRSLLCYFLALPSSAYSAFELPCAGVAILKLAGHHGLLAGLGPIA
jgi:broad specificity phosphatase PhoE